MSQRPYQSQDGKVYGSVNNDNTGCDHRNARSLGSDDAGCCERMCCQDCGKYFKVEWPD